MIEIGMRMGMGVMGGEERWGKSVRLLMLVWEGVAERTEEGRTEVVVGIV